MKANFFFFFTYFRGFQPGNLGDLQINWNIIVISHHVSKLYY